VGPLPCPPDRRTFVASLRAFVGAGFGAGPHVQRKALNTEAWPDGVRLAVTREGVERGSIAMPQGLSPGAIDES
jgi:hypothetical protein